MSGDAGATQLERWKLALSMIESRCPWPGPRPLSPRLDGNKRWRLVGRELDLVEFLDMLDQHALIVFHGESGTGKSSFLQMGLRRAMSRFNYKPYICSRWPQPPPTDTSADADETTNAAAFEAYVSRVFADNMGIATDSDFYRYLTEVGLGRAVAAQGGESVLVFDQFEEYLRKSSPQQVRQFAAWLVTVNRSVKIRVVISMRSEFTYRFTDILSRLRPFSFDTFRLPPITDPKKIKTILTGPPEHAIPQLDSDAADLLIAEWVRCVDPGDPTALLKIHAVLYALYWRTADAAGPADTVCIGADDVSAFIMAANEDPFKDVFDLAFFETINAKLRHCATATDELGQVSSRVLGPMAREQLYRAAPKLSEGDYKKSPPLWDVFQDTYEVELGRLGFIADEALPQARAVFDALWANALPGNSELLGVNSRELLLKLGDRVPAVIDHSGRAAELLIDRIPWDEDPDDSSSGVVLGWQPVEVLTELLRVFIFGACWLDEANICRIGDQVNPEITLIHDGLARALQHWVRAAKHNETPSAQVASLTAIVGDRFSWSESAELCGTADHPVQQVNLRWQRSQIRDTLFRHITFINCDFRNTRFTRCRFEGVIFLNCLLDGVLIEDSRIIGLPDADGARASVPNVDDLSGDRLPSFMVQAETVALEPLIHYRGYLTSAPEVARNDTLGWAYSATSGVPAAPVHVPLPGVGLAPQPNGGLLVLGGRLSALMMRHCTFDDTAQGESRMALAFVAGSSFDMVEQDELRLDIIGCALRGLTVSRPVDATVAATGDARFDISVESSKIANVWLSDRLSGACQVSDCTVFGLTSLSPVEHFAVTIGDDCTWDIAFNVPGLSESNHFRAAQDADAVRGTWLSSGGWDQTTGARADILASIPVKTDYRAIAARRELEARVVSAPEEER